MIDWLINYKYEVNYYNNGEHLEVYYDVYEAQKKAREYSAMYGNATIRKYKLFKTDSKHQKYLAKLSWSGNYFFGKLVFRSGIYC